MKKSTMLKKIQQDLPKGITVIDSTKIEFTIDEYFAILSWIKCFQIHYKEFGKTKHVPVHTPVVSRRVFIDFALYRFPSKLPEEKEKNCIYIGELKKRISENKYRYFTELEIMAFLNLNQ